MPTAKWRSHYKRLPLWKLRLHLATERLGEVFPGPTEYPGSLRAQWVSRIQSGHKAESERISRLATAEPMLNEFLDDWLVDDLHQMNHLTDAMYAAFIVALWSDMEDFLKVIIRMCDSALKVRQKALSDMRKFCRDFNSDKTPRMKYDAVSKALKEALSEVYKFGEMKGLIEKRSGIKCEQCAAFPTVNAIRILNNAFKHSAGKYYEDPEKPHDCIDPTLLKKWSVVDDNNKCEYAKLPIPELVEACNAFCNDLIAKVDGALEQRTKKQRPRKK